jgi:integrase
VSCLSNHCSNGRDCRTSRYSLRHTANSLLIEAGEDPLAIAGSLGHADTRMMFERYGHLFDHTARRVAGTANRIFDRLEAERGTTD